MYRLRMLILYAYKQDQIVMYEMVYIKTKS